MYFFLIDKRCQQTARCLCYVSSFIMITRGEKITNFSQGLDVTIKTSVYLSSCFTGIMDLSDTAREQSDFRQSVYPLVWIKEDHVATKTLQDLPFFPASSPFTLPRRLSLYPSNNPSFFPTAGPLHGIFLLPGLLYPLCLMKLLLLVPSLKITSSEKTYLSITKLASINILMTDCLGNNSWDFLCLMSPF